MKAEVSNAGSLELGDPFARPGQGNWEPTETQLKIIDYLRREPGMTDAIFRHIQDIERQVHYAKIKAAYAPHQLRAMIEEKFEEPERTQMLIKFELEAPDGAGS